MITIEDIIEAAKLEDPLCIELVTQAGGELGHQLAGLINLLNPIVSSLAAECQKLLLTTFYSL